MWLGTVSDIVPETLEGKQKIISNCELDFRCCLGEITANDTEITIDQVTALRLNLKTGDPIRVVDLRTA